LTNNRLAEVVGWLENLTSYGYDEIGRLITTTLPNGVLTVQSYGDNGRLLHLRYTAAGETLLAEFSYQLDGVGNRVVATETLRLPGPYEMLAERLTSSATWQEHRTRP
jgi:YD repeat-containing protein